MKPRLLALVATSLLGTLPAPGFAGPVASRFVGPVALTCSTGPKARPQIVLAVTVNAVQPGISAANRATITASVFPFYGAETPPKTFALSGCSPAQQAEANAKSIYVECAGDGDAGYLDLRKRRDGTIVGTFNLPNGSTQLNLPDAAALSLKCR